MAIRRLQISRLFASALFITFALSFSVVLAAYGSPLTGADIRYVVDGDTVVTQIRNRPEKVRLIGMDAPECQPNPKARRDAARSGEDLRKIYAMGRKATEFMKSLVRPGDPVKIELDIRERDQYGRLLAYVWLKDGRLLNEEMVRAGYAVPMTIAPNVKYRDRFLKANREAREGKRGLWSSSPY